jgi:hypothetical protein
VQEEKEQMNSLCPHCGEDSLRATITATYCNVPLGNDGYFIPDGQLQDEQLLSITCSSCEKKVSEESYFREDKEEKETNTVITPSAKADGFSRLPPAAIRERYRARQDSLRDGTISADSFRSKRSMPSARVKGERPGTLSSAASRQQSPA